MELQQSALRANLGPRDTSALPDHVMNRIEAGEAPAKIIREWRGLSQADLADRTGVAITQIMRAETDREVSMPALRLIARGLRVCDDLLIRRR